MENKIKPYLKITYFQDNLFEHNNTETIIENEEKINKILKVLKEMEVRF